jgi:CubicO group peptidase (beta-lactamase class C family)
MTKRHCCFILGSKWQYCQTGINTAAQIVEVVSGKSFPEFLQERVSDPLGMKDSTFFPIEAQIPRIALAYQRIDSGNSDVSAIRCEFQHAAQS